MLYYVQRYSKYIDYDNNYKIVNEYYPKVDMYKFSKEMTHEEVKAFIDKNRYNISVNSYYKNIGDRIYVNAKGKTYINNEKNTAKFNNGELSARCYIEYLECYPIRATPVLIEEKE